ncbi:ras GEF [Hesseltinella vesiculosa]|uniref:Ras GEF n=1 Tax=Hesseltinella vesiculosa TaxID=101127 RepID=A0A1X2GEK3_9FUNG|nr:ras GEF [Hesseltinella vesiculosa]
MPSDTSHSADSPVLQETAIPAPKRTRNNSIIPVELLNNTTGSSSRERAALATVFGVPEYSQSKIFWERRRSDAGQQQTPTDKSHDPHPLVAPNADTAPPQFVLPTIPNVSLFNDFLIRDDHGDDLMFPASPSSMLLDSWIPSLHHMPSDASLHSAATDSLSLLSVGPLSQAPENVDPAQVSMATDQVTAPLLFIGYPPSIFDLLKLDDDDRIIVWGPDPKEVSASMATTTARPSVTSVAPSATPSASSATTVAKSPANRPVLRGFSSNTTTATPPAAHQPEPVKPNLLGGLKKTLRSKSLMHRPSKDNLRQLLIKRTFGRTKSTLQMSTATNEPSALVSKVIEAASVEKLVEKLTITLDYDFMTDFFLTYRSFISPTQLCKLLILRFRWALENDGPERKIVRIRTFVVMRHWLLNYFVHDFIPSRDLRVVLTTFLNALPHHPLVKCSPRDQRIVKGLKRVVRRLKRVYYDRGDNAQRVQVIAPPPPPAHQERVEEKVRATLSDGLLRRKTALVRGMDVRGKHNGNMAVVDARHAPVVVIGNVPGKRRFSQQQENSSSAGLSSVNVPPTIEEPNLNPIDESQPAASDPDPGTISDDDSLESDISPGTTEIDSDDDDVFEDASNAPPLENEPQEPLDGQQDGSHPFSSVEVSGGAGQIWKAEQNPTLSKLEIERLRREEEEERQRMAFFSSSNLSSSFGRLDRSSTENSLSTLTTLSSSITHQQDRLSAFNDAAHLHDAVSSSALTTTTGSIVDPLSDAYSTSASASAIASSSTVDQPDDQQRLATLAVAMSNLDGPLKKAAIGDMASGIPRAPSNRWCQDPAEMSMLMSIRRDSRMSFPLMPSNLDLSQPPAAEEDSVSLAKHLSQKSIQQRKSERNLRELVLQQDPPPPLRTSVSTPSSLRPVHQTKEAPPMPSKPTLTPKRSIAALRKAKDEKTLLDKPDHLPPPRASDDFEAIPYHQTVAGTASQPSSRSKEPATSSLTRKKSTPSLASPPPTPKPIRPSLSKKLVSMVFAKTPTTTTATIKQKDASTPASSTPSSPPTASITPASPASLPRFENLGSEKVLLDVEPPQQTSHTFPVITRHSFAPNALSPSRSAFTGNNLAATNTTLVSRIAQELRESDLDMDIDCDCTRCTGKKTGPRACRRFSVALLGDEEKRYSKALLQFRQQQTQKQAPTEQQNAADRLGSNNSRPLTSPQSQPMYLGQLVYQESDTNLHIEEMEDDDSDSVASFSSSSSSTSDALVGNGAFYKQAEKTTPSVVSLRDHSSPYYSKQQRRSSSPAASVTLLQSIYGNRSFDRLTTIATKGDGASIHQQVFSVTSLSSIMNPSSNRLSLSLPVATQSIHQESTSPSASAQPALLAIPTGADIHVAPTPTPSGVLAPSWMDSEDPLLSLGLHSHGSMAAPPTYTPDQDFPHEHGSFILYYRSSKLAQQLCFIERDVLLGVDWEEMVHCRWTKMNTPYQGATDQTTVDDIAPSMVTNNDGVSINYTRQTRQMQLARDDGYGGIEQVIERFNTVCQWVASEIVSCNRMDLRVKVIEKFIRLAQKCKMYSNFATLVQILLGLQSPWVSRLKKTWSRVGSREMRLLEELSLFTSPMRNWKHIRDNMTTVAEEYGMSPTEVQVEMPGTNPRSFRRTKVKIPFGGCIPFLGIYLSDLVFNSEQPPYLEPSHDHHRIYHEQTTQNHRSVSPVLKQPLVNFRKHRITATVIKRVLTFQNLARRYAFDLDEDVYELCLLLDPLDTEAIRKASIALE